MIRTATLLIFTVFYLSLAHLSAQDFRVQIAAYAEKMSDTIFQEKGLENVIVTYDKIGLYRYYAGSFATREEAEKTLQDVISKGFPNASIIDLEEQRVLSGANCHYSGNGLFFVQDPSGNIQNIYFDFGSYTLTDESKKVLDDVYEKLKENPKLKLKILGHTDGVGDPQANIRLADNRSRTARNYLINKGVRADRMFLKTYGEAAPVVDNKTDEGEDLPENRKWNRRVVLTIIDDSGEVKTTETMTGGK